MERSDTISAISPLLRHRLLRVLLIAAPGIMAAVAILTATESNLALIVVLNSAAGIIISSSLFLAVSMVAHKVADERVGLARAVEQGFWRGRAQFFSIHHEETGLYTDWYFRLRLQEEFERSQRYGLHFSVLVVKPMGFHQEAELPTAGDWLGDQVGRTLRRSDLVALTRDGALAVLLPNTGRRSAETLRRRLTKALASIQARVGLACFPDDQEDPDALIDAATRACLAQPEAGVA